MPFRRHELAPSIADRLNLLANQLKTRTRARLTDANHSLEFVMARFFNALFDWNLVDLNAEQADFPAADLGDRPRRIAMQITNEDSAQKISGTAEKARAHRLGETFDLLIIFFLLPRKPSLPKKFVQPEGGPKIETWDLADLLKQMNNLPDVNVLAAATRILEEETGTIGSLGSLLYTLPPRPAGFVGREGDLEILRALDPAAGAVLTGLRGMPGIGKTALALVLAHEWAPRFPDAQLFLDARGTQPDPPAAQALMEQVIRTFHPDAAPLPDDPDALAARYRQVLGGKKVLLLLDNARDAVQARPLIPPAGCAFIVTSRLSILLGTVRPHDVGRLPDTEAAALLREFHPDLTDAHAAALVKLCAGLPLALRLAGSHLALDGPAPDVSGYLRKLGGGRLAHLDAEAAEAGEITISETLRLSTAQLPPDERAAWEKLGVFTASFEARAAETIAGAGEEMLGRFVRRSLLEREGGDRYRLHDLAADYARAQLGSDALPTLHRTHAAHYTAVGDETQGIYMKGDAVGGLALFDRERAQIEAAYTWLAARGDEAAARQVLALVGAVVYAGDLRFHPHQRIAWLESQLRAARLVGDRQAEGTALGNLGSAHFTLGGAGEAIEFYEQWLVIAREIGDRSGEGSALGNLGNAHAAMGDARKAIEFHEQALVIDREIGDRRGEGNALGNLGIAHDHLRDARSAIGFYKQQISIFREIGDRRGEGNALGNLGNAHYSLGDARQAIEFHEQHRDISREIGDRSGEGNALGNLGIAHKNLGDVGEAIEFYEQQLVIVREIGDRRGEGNALGNLGIAHYSLGDARQALEFHEQRLAIAREIGDRRGEGNALLNSAVALHTLGNRPEAIARAEAALAIYEAVESPTAAKVRAALAEWRGEG
jgi:tetratricopeptide (TPR) repeat protein